MFGRKCKDRRGLLGIDSDKVRQDQLRPSRQNLPFLLQVIDNLQRAASIFTRGVIQSLAHLPQ